MTNRKLQLNKGDLMTESRDFKFELVFSMAAGTLDFTAIFPVIKNSRDVLHLWCSSWIQLWDYIWY